jgi:hypothetical protein
MSPAGLFTGAGLDNSSSMWEQVTSAAAAAAVATPALSLAMEDDGLLMLVDGSCQGIGVTPAGVMAGVNDDNATFLDGLLLGDPTSF